MVPIPDLQLWRKELIQWKQSNTETRGEQSIGWNVRSAFSASCVFNKQFSVPARIGPLVFGCCIPCPAGSPLQAPAERTRCQYQILQHLEHVKGWVIESLIFKT